jgi:small subunit ribosomal protein S17
METKKKLITCKVVSDKMQQSRVGLVERLIKHPIADKYVKRTARLMFHDEQNLTKVGDIVSVSSCRPLSKRKTFVLERIESRGEQ